MSTTVDGKQPFCFPRSLFRSSDNLQLKHLTATPSRRSHFRNEVCMLQGAMIIREGVGYRAILYYRMLRRRIPGTRECIITSIPLIVINRLISQLLSYKLSSYDNMPASNPIALKNKFVLSILLFAISGGNPFDAITLSKTLSLHS